MKRSSPGERTPVSNTADTQRNAGTRLDTSTSQIVVCTLSEERGTSLPHFRSKTEGEHVVPTVSIDYFFMGPSGQEEAQGVLRCWQ